MGHRPNSASGHGTVLVNRFPPGAAVSKYRGPRAIIGGYRSGLSIKYPITGRSLRTKKVCHGADDTVIARL